MQIAFLILIFVFMLASASDGKAQTLYTVAASDEQPADKLPSNSSELREASSTTSTHDDARFSPIVRTTVRVNSSDREDKINYDAPEPSHASAKEILSSAGTYGDFSRFLQLFPGVVFNTDESNDVLVRGGNPIENLYLVDGIEVPNINHIATEASTGGLVSMIDTMALDSVDLHTGGYDASYEERLSSVVDVHTKASNARARLTEIDAGFVGAGGIQELPLGNDSSILVSGHRSLLNLFTNNIGLNGVPTYTNGIVRAQLKLNPYNDITVLGLSGIDSINITPEPKDWGETNTIQTQYSGWRFTSGLRWQHRFSNQSFGNLTISDSEQNEKINQQDQFFNHNVPGEHSPLSNVPIPVYSELTHDGMTNIKYDSFASLGAKLAVIGGGSFHLYRIKYNVAQPEGQQSPLNINPDHTDAISFAPGFSTGEEGGYIEATWRPAARWSISGGERVQHFQFGGNSSFTPRLSSAFRISSHNGFHASFGEYAQMPPFVYLTSWPQNYALHPIRARHIVAGIDVYSGNRGRIGIEVYQKDYHDYPVSTEYPTLSLANMVDTLGQQFIWIPLTSRGMGMARGIEVSGQAHLGAHISGQANVVYARAEYAGLDGILRPGNFDYPIVVNFAGSFRSGKHYEASWRYEYSTGRPYTPYLLNASAQQDRPIYDLARINFWRGPAYSRLDLQADRVFFLGTHQLVAYAGLENAFDRRNLLGYFWMPRLGAVGGCVKDPDRCVNAQYQMPLMPNFGMRYFF